MANVVITGGSRGIGAAAVERFAARGDSVWFFYAQNESAARAIAEKTGATAICCNVSDSAAVEAAFRQIPDVDILISYTGLRPGEKLYEEKLMNEEGMKTTPNKLIHIGSPIPFDTDVFLAQLQKLMDACYENREDIRELVEEMVPTYHPAGSQGSEQKGKAYEEQLRQMAGIK